MSIYDYKASINTIKHLAKYFHLNFTDRENLDDKHLDHYKYALEAFESLVDNARDSNRMEQREFEYLTGLLNYELFANILEEGRYIDAIVDIFEAR